MPSFPITRISLLLMLIINSASTIGQKKFKVKAIETVTKAGNYVPDRYVFIDEKGNKIPNNSILQ